MQITLPATKKVEPRVTAIVILWGLLAFYLGANQTFSTLPLPLFGLTVMALMGTLILLYYRSSVFRTFSDSIPLKFIALFHSWRIFAGWIFLAYSDRLPETFINNAAYGDIIAGFLGLSVFVTGHAKRAYLFFHVIGSIDFVLAVGTGLTLTILGESKMASIAQLPLILIPLFGVPLSGFTHFISLVRIFKATDKKMGDVLNQTTQHEQ